MGKKEKREYEVYVGRWGKEVVYVGSGRAGRHKHLNSGVSHIYEANKIHFEGGVFDVELVGEGLSKREALDLETQLIKKYDPRWNLNHRGRVSPIVNVKSIVTRYMNTKDQYPWEVVLLSIILERYSGLSDTHTLYTRELSMSVRTREAFYRWSRRKDVSFKLPFIKKVLDEWHGVKVLKLDLEWLHNPKKVKRWLREATTHPYEKGV